MQQFLSCSERTLRGGPANAMHYQLTPAIATSSCHSKLPLPLPPLPQPTIPPPPPSSPPSRPPPLPPQRSRRWRCCPCHREGKSTAAYLAGHPARFAARLQSCALAPERPTLQGPTLVDQPRPLLSAGTAVAARRTAAAVAAAYKEGERSTEVIGEPINVIVGVL